MRLVLNLTCCVPCFLGTPRYSNTQDRASLCDGLVMVILHSLSFILEKRGTTKIPSNDNGRMVDTARC